MLYGWELEEALLNDPYASRTFIGVYTLHETWRLPQRFPAAYLINTGTQNGPGEHWVAVFLEDTNHGEYFDSYGTAPLESIYQRLRNWGYHDVRFSTKMIQGPWSRSCGLYAFYYIVSRSRGIPLGSVTSVFREYDFTYNEALIRNGLL